MTEGKFTNDYVDNLERLGGNFEEDFVFSKLLWRKFKTIFVSAEITFRVTSLSRIRFLLPSDPGSYSVQNLILLFRAFSDERINDDPIIHEEINIKVLNVLGYYNYPEQLTIWTIGLFIENQGDEASAAFLSRSLAEKYRQVKLLPRRNLVGQKSRSFGHQIMMSEYIYKHSLISSNPNGPPVLVPCADPASPDLELINRRIFGVSGLDYRRVSLLKCFSFRENGGYLDNMFYSGGYWGAVLNYSLDRNGATYYSPIIAAFNDLYTPSSFEPLIHRLRKNGKRLILLYFRTPLWKGAVEHRDTDPIVMLEFTLYLLRSGYSVCRIGDKVDIFTSISSDAFYDRPSDATAQDGIDIALAINCDLAVMGSGGAAALPLALGKQTLLFDTAMTCRCIYYKNARFLFRSHYKDGKVLPYEYFSQRGLSGTTNAHHLRKLGVSSNSNTLRDLIRYFSVFVDETSDIGSFQRRSVDSALWATKFGHSAPLSLALNEEIS